MAVTFQMIKETEGGLRRLIFRKICRNFYNVKKIGRKGSNYMADPYLPTIFGRKWPEAATVSDLAIEMTSCRVKVVIFKPLGSKSSLKCIFWLLAHLVCHQDHFRFNNSFIFTTNILTSRKCSRIVYSRIKGLPPYFIKIHQIKKNK